MRHGIGRHEGERERHEARRTAVIRKLSLGASSATSSCRRSEFIAGIMGNSSAMVSDAVHSLSDVFATFIAFLASGSAGARPTRPIPTDTSASRASPPSCSASSCW